MGDAQPAIVRVDNQSAASIQGRVSGVDYVVPPRTEVELVPASWDAFVITIFAMDCVRLAEHGFTNTPLVWVVVDPLAE